MSKQFNQLYEFGEFQLDVAERLLRHGERLVPLTPKAFETLLVLVQSSGHLVEKDELMDQVWPDAVVEEANLARNIWTLRKALGDDEREHRYIETVPKLGYRFVAPVTVLTGEPVDVLIQRKVRAHIVTENSSDSHQSLPLTESSGFADLGKVVPRAGRQGVSAPHKGRYVILLVAFAIAISGVAILLYKLMVKNQLLNDPAAAFQKIKLAKLTSTGKAADAAISPDGRYVVHEVEDGGRQSLWMRQVTTASNVQIVPPSDVVYSRLIFSRDGNYIYYIMWDKKTTGGLYQMPVLGGAARELVVDVDSAATFSPDGKRLAFIRGYPSIGESALIVANADGAGEQKLAVRKSPDDFSSWGGRRNAPAWSPDGKSIAAPAGINAGESILEVRVADGAMKPITSQNWVEIEGVEWLRDGSGLIVSAKEEPSSPYQIWHLSYPAGEARRITNDLNDYKGVSLTADSTALVTVRSDTISDVWIAPNNDVSRATQITSERSDGQGGISWTPDGKIVYTSRVAGNSDLWIMDADGSHQKQLTTGSRANYNPSVSADGRYIVFISDRTGMYHIWRMNTDGSNPKQLTNGPDERVRPDCSPDNQWVIYAPLSGTAWKAPIDGGDPVQLTDHFLHGPVISPDGKLIAGFYWVEGGGKTAIYPFAGGQLIKSLDIWNFVRWAPDGRSLAYIDLHDPANIYSQPIDGGQPVRLTDFKDGRIFNFAWSRDGKQLALARGTMSSDVVLIKDFR
jgi:eukaryotic-like serine/threonine-protein kinase